MKIAIVDDSSFSRMQLKYKLLEIEKDAEIVSFKDGVEATEGIPGNGFDKITLDMTMPNKDGLETLIDLRKMGVDVPIYMLSANIQKTAQQRCLDAGCMGFIPKPIETEALQVMFEGDQQ